MAEHTIVMEGSDHKSFICRDDTPSKRNVMEDIARFYHNFIIAVC